jgi:hypothetical protein
LLGRQACRIIAAHERDKDIIVMVTIYPDPAGPRTAGFGVKANGMFTEFLDGPGRGAEMGELSLPLDHDTWTTRIYDGKQDRDTLQAILRVPSEITLGTPVYSPLTCCHHKS